MHHLKWIPEFTLNKFKQKLDSPVSASKEQSMEKVVFFFFFLTRTMTSKTRNYHQPPFNAEDFNLWFPEDTELGHLYFIQKISCSSDIPPKMWNGFQMAHSLGFLSQALLPAN